MSDTTLHDDDDGWTREFWFHGDEKAADAEASAYVDGIEDAAPGRYEIDRYHHDNRIEVVVRPKGTE